MNVSRALTKDDTTFVPPAGAARAVDLEECLRKELLVAPDSKRTLFSSGDLVSLFDGHNHYSVVEGCPLLYPREITESWVEHTLPLAYYGTPLKQYGLLSQLKQRGEINAPLDSQPARKHQHRLWDFCRGLQGLVLDVGCDSPAHSTRLLPPSCEYLGLDPYANGAEFRIIGLGEIIPIRSASVDNVLFNTSLDHILDYQTAIDEAFRVLKPGGRIVIATYAWVNHATLLSDSVHFHHFREYEILGALTGRFRTENVMRYEDPKGSAHRYGLYVQAAKCADEASPSAANGNVRSRHEG